LPGTPTHVCWAVEHDFDSLNFNCEIATDASQYRLGNDDRITSLPGPVPLSVSNVIACMRYGTMILLFV